MQYNTARPQMGMREHGRHIQKMVDFLLTIEDKEKRQQQAEVLIELMGFLNPHLKNVEDFRHKLWDHLFFMSDFKLDVESPYPIPEKETYKEKPEPLPYPERHPKYAHLGKNIELVINKALSETNEEKKDGFANAVAYYMKLAYSNWHNELVQDTSIQSELDNITGGQLQFENTPFIKHKDNTNTGSNRNQNKNKNRPGFSLRSSNNPNKQRNGNQPSNNNRNNNNNRDNNNRNSFKKKY